MSIGISLLVHQDLDRAALLVHALAEHGCKVAIHVDAKVSDSEYAKFSSALPDIDFVPRIACEWGTFSLVQAQMNTAVFILEKHSDVNHVVQLSGSCLPTRPISEFLQFLAKYPDTDFIESTLAGGHNWIKDGLEAERFTLYFPFSWTRQRRRFDAFVSLQRKLNISRKIPEGLVPHIGSQWWALTRKTILAIANDPNRAEYDKYFEKSWIPDELYFQTIARKHSQNILSRSMTFNRFDYQGKPMVFYDDHLQYLGHLSGFFIRKIWRGADGLYQALLNPAYAPGDRVREKRQAFQAMITQAETRRVKGRRGLVMQSCAPKLSKRTSAAEYQVLGGFDAIFDDFDIWFQDQTMIPLHGRLFAKSNANFAGGQQCFTGNQSNHSKIRNYNPVNYLIGFIWNNRLSKNAFRFHGRDNLAAANFIARDPNAIVFHIRNAWLLDLMRRQITDTSIFRRHAEKLAKAETKWCKQLEKGKAKTLFVSLDDALTSPEDVLGQVIKSIRPDLNTDKLVLPPIKSPEGLSAFLRQLADNGIDIANAGVHPAPTKQSNQFVAE